jgi:ABC-type proline/glycine betaine transport system permease subunit
MKPRSMIAFVEVGAAWGLVATFVYAISPAARLAVMSLLNRLF